MGFSKKKQQQKNEQTNKQNILQPRSQGPLLR